MAVGDEVYAVGNPRGLEGTFSAGIISGIRTAEDARILQITAPVSPGSSGGPVLTIKGTVIGVAVAFLKGGQNLNFAIPVSDVKNLLADLKPVAVLSPAKKERTESLAERLGERSNTGVVPVSVEIPPYSNKVEFSLQNNLQSGVKNVRYRIIYYDMSHDPIDYRDGPMYNKENQ